jgi:hypothetical protein
MGWELFTADYRVCSARKGGIGRRTGTVELSGLGGLPRGSANGRMRPPAAGSPQAGHRFPLGLRMLEEMPAARGIIVGQETLRQWAPKLGQAFAERIRRRLPHAGDKWHLDEVAIGIAGAKHWLRHAVDQTGTMLHDLCSASATRRPPGLARNRFRQCRRCSTGY